MKYFKILSLLLFLGCASSYSSNSVQTTGPTTSPHFNSDIVILDDGLEIPFSDCEEPKKPVEIVNGIYQIYSKVRYPMDAVSAGIQETIVHNVLIDETGNIFEIKLKEGSHPSLIEEAERVIKTAQFKPAICNGHTVKMYFPTTIRFVLQDD